MTERNGPVVRRDITAAERAETPQARRAAQEVARSRSQEVDVVARNVIHSAVFYIRDGLRGSYDDLPDDVWAEITARVKEIIRDNVEPADVQTYEKAYQDLQST